MKILNKIICLIFFLNFSIVFAQDSIIYNINFHKYFIREGQKLTKFEYTKIYPKLKSKPKLIKEKDVNVISSFHIIKIYEKNDGIIYRLIKRCDDCKRTYYLFYENKRKVKVIEADNPLEVLNEIAKNYDEDHIVLDEGDLILLLKESFFYFKYKEFYSNLNALPNYIKKKQN